ncbi:MAG: STAS domain-containing protein [Fibrobacterota bacterium]
MNIKTWEVKDVSVLSIEGGLMQEAADNFLLALIGLLDNGKVRAIVDFRDCSYITSPNLSALFQYKKMFVEKGGDIKVACINSAIRSLFEKTNLDKIIEVFESIDSAVGSFPAVKGKGRTPPCNPL